MNINRFKWNIYLCQLFLLSLFVMIILILIFFFCFSDLKINSCLISAILWTSWYHAFSNIFSSITNSKLSSICCCLLLMLLSIHYTFILISIFFIFYFEITCIKCRSHPLILKTSTVI